MATKTWSPPHSAPVHLSPPQGPPLYLFQILQPRIPMLPSSFLTPSPKALAATSSSLQATPPFTVPSNALFPAPQQSFLQPEVRQGKGCKVATEVRQAQLTLWHNLILQCAESTVKGSISLGRRKQTLIALIKYLRGNISYCTCKGHLLSLPALYWSDWSQEPRCLIWSWWLNSSPQNQVPKMIWWSDWAQWLIWPGGLGQDTLVTTLTQSLPLLCHKKWLGPDRRSQLLVMALHWL